MATRSKSSKRIFWAAVFVIFCSVVTLCAFETAKQRVESQSEEEQSVADNTEQSWPDYNGDSLTNLKSMIRYIYVGSYGMYWELQQKIEQKPIAPSEIFLPAYVNNKSGDSEAAMSYFDQNFESWFQNFGSLLQSYQIEYQICDRDTGESYTNSIQDLSVYEEEEDVPFFMKMSFDGEGNLSIGTMKNEDEIQLSVAEVDGMTKERFLLWIGGSQFSASILKQPVNVDLYIYSRNAQCYVSQYGSESIQFVYNTQVIVEEQCSVAYGLLLLFLAVSAFLLPVFKGLRREEEWIGKIPAEAAVLGIIFGLLLEDSCVSLCYMYATESFGSHFFLYLMICFGCLTVIYGWWFLSVMVLLQIPDLGPRRFLREKSFLLRTVNRTYGGVRNLIQHFIESIRTVDLSDKSDTWLLKIVGANFAVLLLCCLLWFWGVFGLLVYSAALFFVLRRYLKGIKEQYAVLLTAASQMAQGNLQMDIEENLGIFEPLKEELAKVNSGFRKAVEAEIKSQNMKTELITNVSHDLKTPLTAIITYVNLLKDESITPEERRNYVEILDRKSLRLKNLIEDLFEVSKAASGNIKIEKTQVDLGEMVKQAAAEQEDRMKEAQIECRISVPEERVLMELDGEKTYRILENLLVNVTKYGLAGTRAWLSLTADETQAEIVLKNISATELEGDSSRLTERFVRGDKARNTEGSGLGLAIVESFVQLQGGSFRIVVDGDLFKAIVRFPRS